MCTLQYAVFNCSHWLFFTRHTLIHFSIKHLWVKQWWLDLNFSLLPSQNWHRTLHPQACLLAFHMCSRWPAGLSSNLPSGAQQNLNDGPSASGWVERCCFGGLLCGLWSSNPHIHRHRCPLYGARWRPILLPLFLNESVIGLSHLWRGE